MTLCQSLTTTHMTDKNFESKLIEASNKEPLLSQSQSPGALDCFPQASQLLLHTTI